MFYDLILLRRQNHGRFAMAWVASTRGINTVIREFGRDKVRDMDIVALCDETMNYLTNNSNNPKERLSLRMAVHLLEGTIILFARKVAIFEDDSYRAYNIISTFPKELFPSVRGKAPTQRNFKTPPMPVVREKGKRKRQREESISEEMLKQIIEIEQHDSAWPAEIPSEFQARKEDITILESQPLHVILPDDMFGEFDVGPTAETAAQWTVPHKSPSEVAEKSQLDKIVEQLIEEQIPQRKKSSSSSVDGGPRQIQVEAVVHKEPTDVRSEVRVPEEGPSGSGFQEGSTRIVVEALVHRPAEEEAVAPALEEFHRIPTIMEPMEIEEIGTLEEAAAVTERISEKEEISSRKLSLRQLQKDEIPTPGSGVSRKLTKAEKERREKEQKIAKYLTIQFRAPRRVVRLNDFKKRAKLTIDFPIKIFVENRFSTERITNFLLNVPDAAIEIEGAPLEQMRLGGASSSLDSNILRRMSKAPSSMTPQDVQVRPSSQLLAVPSRIPVSGEFLERLPAEPFQSTPMREGVELPRTQLYPDTRIEYEIPVQEAIDRQGEQIIDAQPPIQEKAEEELLQLSPTTPAIPRTKEQEEEKLKRDIATKVSSWDESQGYLLVDDLIPEPKNRKNAAKLFFLLLALAKVGLVVLIPEENSSEVKYVKRGKRSF